VSKGRTFPTGVGAPILLEGIQVIGRVRASPHPQVSSIAPSQLRPRRGRMTQNTESPDTPGRFTLWVWGQDMSAWPYPRTTVITHRYTALGGFLVTSRL
jgi:hypothetical protein